MVAEALPKYRPNSDVLVLALDVFDNLGHDKVKHAPPSIVFPFISCRCYCCTGAFDVVAAYEYPGNIVLFKVEMTSDGEWHETVLDDADPPEERLRSRVRWLHYVRDHVTKTTPTISPKIKGWCPTTSSSARSKSAPRRDARTGVNSLICSTLLEP